MNDLMCRVAQTVGERHRYDIVAIYVSEPGEREMRLSGWLGGARGLRAISSEEADVLIRQAMAEKDSRLVRDGESWRAAIPISGARFADWRTGDGI